VIAMIEIMHAASEFKQLAIDAEVAFEFVKKEPRTLEELQVSSDG
jgi:hypothetical protein